MQISAQRTGSRKEIIKWVNSTLDIRIASVEQLGTGAAYCQLLDVINPGSVPLNKVNWKAKSQYEYISNFKVLQTSITHLGIDIKLNIQKLIKCKYQDNLQLIQHFKKLIDKQGIPIDYNPSKKRNPLANVTQRKSLVLNKQNIFKKTDTNFNSPNIPTTAKSSKTRHISFCFDTPVTVKSCNSILQKSNQSQCKVKIKSTNTNTNKKTTKPNKNKYWIPNRQISDEKKYELIKKILLQNQQNQIQRINRIVFQQEDSDTDQDSEFNDNL